MRQVHWYLIQRPAEFAKVCTQFHQYWYDGQFAHGWHMIPDINKNSARNRNVKMSGWPVWDMISQSVT
jgi:hypothetical protein